MQLSSSSTPAYQRFLPHAVFLLGIAYLAFLASAIPTDVFFSGDGGVKYLVVKQINAGEGFKYLHIGQPDWVKQLWENGYFPMKQPFTYPSAGGYIISFPPAFQWISAVLYKQFGYIGLYIIPVASLVGSWLCLLYILSYLGVDPLKKAVALFLLIFCSPLTVYGTAYWEHTFAVLLLSAGLVFIIKKQVSFAGALLLGLFSGAAVWLRPEALVMNFLYGIAALIEYKRQGKKFAWPFLAGIAVMSLAFFYANHKIYGAFLGAHSFQVLEEHGALYKLARGVKYAAILNWLLIKFFCIALLCIPVFYVVFRKRKQIKLELILLSGIVLLFCLLTPFMTPNTGGGQWGPRYFLSVMPVILVLLAMFWQNEKVSMPAFVLPVAVLLAAFALYLNVYEGGVKRTREEYATRVKPVMDFVKSQPEKIIVVNSEFIPMELADVFRDRHFFLAERKTKLDSLMQAMPVPQQETFLYISDRNESPGLPNIDIQLSGGLKPIGRNYYYGKYKWLKKD